MIKAKPPFVTMPKLTARGIKRRKAVSVGLYKGGKLVGARGRSVKILPDKDRDGVPDVLDCRPNNPREQGWVHDVAVKAKTGYQKWRAEAPERATKTYEAKKERLERAETIETQRAKLEEARARVRKARARALPKARAITTGGLFGAPSGKPVYEEKITFGEIGRAPPKIRKKTKKRVTKRKPRKQRVKRRKTPSRKGKRKVVMYI